MTTLSSPFSNFWIRHDSWHRNEFEGGRHPNFVVVPLHFLALKVQLVILVSAFMMVSTLWSVSYMQFFFAHGAPRAQPM